MEGQNTEYEDRRGKRRHRRLGLEPKCHFVQKACWFEGDLWMSVNPAYL